MVGVFVVANSLSSVIVALLYMSTGDSARLSIQVMMAGEIVNLVGRLVEKLVHCGCIVSFNTYLLLDFGGIMCMECSKKNFILARNRCLSHETPVPTGESQLDATQTVIEPQYMPRVTESKLQKISINPLFQKLLSASDADLALSRLVIPKKCAEIPLVGEAYFPRLSGPHKIPINILDTEGKEWNFRFRFWPNSRSKMYVLEGLRDYMVSKKWQAGDVVTFYRIEPGQKLVMGLRNTSAGSTIS
ncbi:B3 domain-containing protein Os07g0679700-like isoform X5 [Solanum dulcamara]|uniref:B3 domain-containing protein Os07g0679700-like isoform X5 n=1 Tax=Solanum dulcamara TaxID=45834 RepID=UPI0024853C92|nr:B3 domain-containing protein Os07g0679700-like isoform X5 [Solanum dulcamara]